MSGWMDRAEVTQGIHVRAAQQSDIPALLTLVADYWEFEGLAGFDAIRLASQLERLLHDANGV